MTLKEVLKAWESDEVDCFTNLPEIGPGHGFQVANRGRNHSSKINTCMQVFKTPLLLAAERSLIESSAFIEDGCHGPFHRLPKDAKPRIRTILRAELRLFSVLKQRESRGDQATPFSGHRGREGAASIPAASPLCSQQIPCPFLRLYSTLGLPWAVGIAL